MFMKRYPKYNQNQLTRIVVLEVVNGAFALILRPHPGAFRQLMCLHPGEFAHFFQENVNPRGLARGGGAWALLELTDA